MTPYKNSFLPARAGRKSHGAGKAGFSLVEVVLAIGIVAFAFVSIMGLVPVGYVTFHQAMDTSVSSQIAQRIINEAQESDLSSLLSTSGVSQGSTNRVAMPVRYFDDRGDEVTTNTGHAGGIYQANTVISGATTMPGGTLNQNLLTVSVQVANSPASQTVQVSNGFFSDPRFSVTTCSALVAGSTTND